MTSASLPDPAAAEAKPAKRLDRRSAAEGTPMAIRLSGMTLGGKLSLGYLVVATFLFVFGGRSSEWFLMVLGFSLLYAPWALEQRLLTRPLSSQAQKVGSGHEDRRKEGR